MQKIKQNKVNVILAALAFLISFVVYMDTIAPTVSFWDCGEFIATSYTLGVPHPPGSPLYLLIGRLFTMLPFSSDIAYQVNIISALTSALAVMFLYLIVVKLLSRWGAPKTQLAKISLYGGAFIGAMTFAFTDSHWFNSVEAEVYSFSTFLTAIVVWLILLWEEKDGQPGHERYLLLIAYIMGLAIGIHLLNLLAIFFIALIIYFKRYSISSNWWLIGDLIIGLAISGIIFLFFLQLDIPFLIQALLTLAVFMTIYIPLYRKSKKPRYHEHAKNVTMAFLASAGFLLINGGVIRGLPKIAHEIGLWALPAVVIIILGVTAWAITHKRNILALVMMSLVLIMVGYSTYTTIFIRSNQDPVIDENNPETTERAISYLEREQYGRRSFTDIFDRRVWKPEAAHKWKDKSTWNYFWNYQIKKMYIRYFNWQFVGRQGANVDPFAFLLPFPFLIGVYGLMTHFKKDQNKALAVLALFLFTGLMIVLYLNQDDPQPRERDYSYVGSFFTFSIWIGIGAAALIGQFLEFKKKRLRKPLVYVVTAVLVLVLPLNVMLANYESHDRSGNYVASDYSYNILQTCEQDGIIFTNGDNDTFPLWYLQEVEGVRKDVRVVNLSLLNTPWYIKQLKNNEPKLDLGSLTDSKIENLSVIPWEKQEVKISPPPYGDLPPLKWTLEPTIMGRGLRVQDIMIWQIIESNRWQRPIYFAVTVSPDNKLGLDPYLQMEGLAFRVFPKRVPRVNAEALRHNLLEVYRYRNLDNPDVYFNENVKKLVSNYRSGFFQLAIQQLRSGDKKAALTTLDSMQTKLPEEVLPIRNKDLYLQLGLLYHEVGGDSMLRELEMEEEVGEEYRELIKQRPQGLAERLDELLRRPRVSVQDKLRYAQIYMEVLKDYNTALDILNQLNNQYPNNPRVLGMLIQTYEQMGNYARAVELLDQWLENNPQDNQAQRMRDQYQSMLRQRGDTSADTTG